ncbi:Ty1/Copia family ribonuclease HI, partial [Naasia lichenicola]
ARLVAKGFTQVPGLHYDEIFAPVVMLRSIRIILAIAAFHDYEIWQMDVKTAFLNGYLEEELYMVQPEGFIDPKHPKKVCKLKRSIYGLKQASRSWNHRFDQVIKDNGFVRSVEEPCLYIKSSGSKIVFLVLYVDDILLIGNDIPLLSSVKAWLKNHFQMKDLGEAQRILGIRIYRDRSRRMLSLSQESYIDKILERFSMTNSKKGFLPMTTGLHLSKSQEAKTSEEKERMSRIPYASAIGSIMYAMICTRPDVAYALSMTSRFQAHPGEQHWMAVKNILKYLRRTKDWGLTYGGDTRLCATGYADASFQTDQDDSKSQSGFVFTLNGAAVSWKSTKQSVTADSTTESEYYAASEAAKEAIWMRQFLQGLSVVPSSNDPITVYCDNKGAIFQAKEPKSSNKSRHVQRKAHLIRDYVEQKEILLEKIATDDNIADPLTKALRRDKHEGHVTSMGIKRVPEL